MKQTSTNTVMKSVSFALATAFALFFGSAQAQDINVNMYASNGGDQNPEDEDLLEGPAGGLGETWNQFNITSGSDLLDTSGAPTSVGFMTSGTLGTGWVWADPALKMIRGGRANFDTSPENMQTFTINGLTPGDVYDVWIASANTLGSQRSAGEWSTVNPTASESTQVVNNIDNIVGDMWIAGNNYVLFEKVEADANGEILFEGFSYDKNVVGFDPRLPLSGWQLRNAVPLDLTLDMTIASNNGDLEFEWESKPGMFYVLRTTTDLAADLQSWTSLDVPGAVENNGVFEIAANPPFNTLTIPRPADPVRLYRVEEFPLPPVEVLSDDFESGQGDWTTGSDGADGTMWELGTPTGVGPAGAKSGANCFATNLSSDYAEDADVWLRSPVIDLTSASAATLSYAEFKDIEEMFDFGAVNILDAADDSLIVEVEGGIDGVSTEWDSVSHQLPEEALGKMIKVEFRLISDDFGPRAGWYIDDVVVTTPAP